MDQVPVDRILPAAKYQRLDRLADDYWRPFRQQGLAQIDYFLGRMYGLRGMQAAKPLNLIAQTIRSFLPKLVPTRLNHHFRPRLSGQELEALVLKKLIERDDEEQDIICNVIEPMISEAWFYALSVCYTGVCSRSMRAPGMAIDQDRGEPITLHIPFERWVCDPFADEFRSRMFERHAFRCTRGWMFESPSFAHLSDDEIWSIPAWEDSMEGREYRQRLGASGEIHGAEDALEETLLLHNVVIYHRTGTYEATICPEGRGPAKWLSAVQYQGADGGPYDHLWFQGVPSMLVPAALIGFTYDIAEAADMLMRKGIDSAIRSKKILGYAAGAEDEAKALIENAHGTMINMDDPRSAHVFDLNLMDKELMAMVEYVRREADEAAGSPRALAGGTNQDNTATKADIRDTRASEQIQYLNAKRDRVISRITRKRAHWFMSDPQADHIISVQSPSGEAIELAYSANNRVGQPQDYSIETTVSATTGTNPELVMRRTLEAMELIGAQMPLFQMGVWDLQRTLRFFARNGAEGLEDIAGDLTLLQERMIAEQMAQAFHERAGGGAGPEGAGGGMGGPPPMPGPGAPMGAGPGAAGGSFERRPESMTGARASARAPMAGAGGGGRR